jgi:ATP-dependent DNA helicase RecQ
MSAPAATATTARPDGGCPPAAAEPFQVGSRVEHEQWGAGVVQRYDGDQIVLLFDSVGYRTLSVELIAERDLLSRA